MVNLFYFFGKQLQ